jgi:hypothetical protein
MAVTATEAVRELLRPCAILWIAPGIDDDRSTQCVLRRKTSRLMAEDAETNTESGG